MPPLFHLNLLLYTQLFLQLLGPLQFLFLHFGSHYLILIVRVYVFQGLSHPSELCLLLAIAVLLLLLHHFHLPAHYFFICLWITIHADQITKVHIIGLLALIEGRRQVLGKDAAVEHGLHQQVFAPSHLLVNVH